MARPVLKGPREMFTLRRVFAFWAALLLVLVVAASAGAQLPTGAATLTVTKTGVVHSAPRNANRLNTFINRADCLADDVVTFPITGSNFKPRAGRSPIPRSSPGARGSPLALRRCSCTCVTSSWATPTQACSAEVLPAVQVVAEARQQPAQEARQQPAQEA